MLGGASFLNQCCAGLAALCFTGRGHPGEQVGIGSLEQVVIQVLADVVHAPAAESRHGCLRERDLIHAPDLGFGPQVWP